MACAPAPKMPYHPLRGYAIRGGTIQERRVLIDFDNTFHLPGCDVDDALALVDDFVAEKLGV